jgi:peptide/nickel transport system ATP-binding protein
VTEMAIAAQSNEAPLLEVENLQVEFRTPRGILVAPRAVSLTIAKGETVGLVGESGSGKSVTAHAVMGLVDNPGRVVSGDIRWKGQSLLTGEGAEAYARAIRGNEVSLVLQDPMTSLNPVFTIRSQMRKVMRRHLKISKAQADARALDLLDLVGINAPQRLLHQYAHELSGGMRQRVLLAIALSCEPELLIADEPTTALDVRTQAATLELLRDTQEKLGLAVLLITHDLGVVASLCHRVEVMYAGLMMERSPAREFFRRPGHPYSAALLRSTPRLDDDLSERLVAIPGSPPDLLDPPGGCPFHPRCHVAIARCATEMPDLADHGDGRRIACWRPFEGSNGPDAATLRDATQVDRRHLSGVTDAGP